MVDSAFVTLPPPRSLYRISTICCWRRPPRCPTLLHTLDGVFRDRWRSLVSVDDMVADLVARLRQMRVLDDTYVIYASDHGYHIGEKA